MTINLLGQNLLLGCTVLVTALLAYAFTKSKVVAAFKSNPKLRKRYLICAFVAVALLVLVQLALYRAFPYDKLPLVGIMATPLVVSIGALVAFWKKGKGVRRALSGAAVGSLALLFLLVNGYYQYYATVSDALNNRNHISDTPATLLQNKHAITATGAAFSQLETIAQMYAPLPATGRVFSFTPPPTASKFSGRAGWVYLPPIAYSPQKLNLPVVVLLAGEPGNPVDWLNGGKADATLNAFAATHHGVAPIVVGVDDLGGQFNDTECVDSPHGNAETYLTVDVPHALKAQFDVSSDPAQWTIGGLSDGGMCGVMLALRHPTTYGYFLDFSGELGPSDGGQAHTIASLFGGSVANWQAHQPLDMLQNLTAAQRKVGGYFGVGKSDSPVVVGDVTQLYKQSSALGLNVAFEAVNGQHTFDVWQRTFRDSLPWLSAHLGAVATPKPRHPTPALPVPAQTPAPATTPAATPTTTATAQAAVLAPNLAKPHLP